MIDQFDRAQQLLREINQAHDLRFTLRERCRGGVVGAWLLADPAGRRAILKCNDGMAHRYARVCQASSSESALPAIRRWPGWHLV